jgi:hypothetical protein
MRTAGVLAAPIRALVLATIVASGTAAQAPGHVVRGVVRDSASGQLLSGAIVQLVGPSVRTVVRSDQQGTFQFSKVPSGTFRLTVRQIGFVEATRELEIGDRDVSLTISLVSTSQQLDTVRVRAHVIAVFGVVGTAVGLKPVADATVQIIGAQQKTTTDSAGRFFVSLKKGGTYFVRVHHVGFGAQMVAVDVPTDRSVETFVLLDSGVVATGAEMLSDEFDERLHWQGQYGALVPAEEITRYGGSVSDAIRGAQSFVKKGLQLGSTVCLFVNGVPRPGWPLDAIPPEQIATVELYTKTGDETNTLAARWPTKAPCGSSAGGGVTTPTSPLNRRSIIQYAVIWLKQ